MRKYERSLDPGYRPERKPPSSRRCVLPWAGWTPLGVPGPSFPRRQLHRRPGLAHTCGLSPGWWGAGGVRTAGEPAWEPDHPERGALGRPGPRRPASERGGPLPLRPAHGPRPGPPVTHFPRSQWRGRLSPSPRPPRPSGEEVGGEGAGLELND